MTDKPLSAPTPGDFFNWMSQFAQPWIEASAKLTGAMPIPAGSDPLEMWKQWQQRNEQTWAEFMSKLVATPEFAAGLGRTTTNTAAIREGVRRAAQIYLDAADMPSREDVTRVAAQIVALDAKVDDMQERQEEGVIDELASRFGQLMNRLENMAQQLDASAKINALEERLSKLETLETRLDNIGKQLDPLAKIATISTNLAKLGTIEEKLDRMAGFDARLSTIEAKLDNLHPGETNVSAPATLAASKPARKPARPKASATAPESENKAEADATPTEV